MGWMVGCSSSNGSMDLGTRTTGVDWMDLSTYIFVLVKIQRSSIPRRSSTSSVELVEIDIDTIDLVSLMIRGTGN